MHISNRQFFLQHIAQTSKEPLLLEIEKASGSLLFTPEGKELIDLIGGISVSNVGHSHPKIVKAVQQQAEKHMHIMVYGEVVQSPQVNYAKQLCKFLPPSLNSIYFTNSGAEATEGALKLAKRFTGRTKIVYCKNAYHGSTHGALSVMGDEYFKRNFRPLLPDVCMINYGDFNDLKNIDSRTAAIIIETIQGESGITVPSIEYMQQLRQQCTETGALLILDEVQAGMGRTGKMFAFEHFDIQPDILTLAKAFGGGMPLGAFIANKSVTDTLTENPILGHITTFGGHPVSCAAGDAALNILVEENLLKTVEQKSLLFEKLLQHKKIKSVRRKGLMMAVQFNSFEENKKIIDLAIANGVFTDWFLFAPESLRIVPPLNIPDNLIEKACSILLDCIDKSA
ncbi:MAG: aspartate aminotransferase family protein [Chitinophagales bacterium]|nr:aspartate aminotransferase family protein [Chitinophagales bacterium]HRN94285.1 aspartate aminotransferase family protein [Chitinophagales bacterium]HRP38624.1 aspartate aminotransferase family protein [Chitinophagales bacterium]